MPEEARRISLSVDTIESSSRLIRRGQETGVFREGDPMLLSKCFWTSVQGIMEEMSFNKEMKAPEPDWIMSILRR